LRFQESAVGIQVKTVKLACDVAGWVDDEARSVRDCVGLCRGVMYRRIELVNELGRFKRSHNGLLHDQPHLLETFPQIGGDAGNMPAKVERYIRERLTPHLETYLRHDPV
jgi:hypothetical protein